MNFLSGSLPPDISSSKDMPMVSDMSSLVPGCKTLVSTTLQKNQLPAFDTFGPFPDETLLSSLDKVLYFLGVNRVQKFFNLPSPTTDICCTNSDCSIAISQISGPSKECTTIVESKCPASPVKPIIVPRSCLCPKCQQMSSVCGGARTSRSGASHVTIRDPNSGDSFRPGFKPIPSMKRSFSLCSLACRKIKEKFGLLSNAGSTDQDNMRWLWTRLQCNSDGHQIYEIFKNSSANKSPSDMGCNIRPEMIFVVLSNGSIVPFQTLKCSCGGRK